MIAIGKSAQFEKDLEHSSHFDLPRADAGDFASRVCPVVLPRALALEAVCCLVAEQAVLTKFGFVANFWYVLFTI